MDLRALLSDPTIIDVVTAEGSTYIITATHKTIPNATVVSPIHLHNFLHLFLTAGYSHRHKQPYASLAGLNADAVYTYDLSALLPTKKQAFSHALRGTGGRPGLLQQWNGRALGRGAFTVPQAQRQAVDAFLTQWAVPNTCEVILRG